MKTDMLKKISIVFLVLAFAMIIFFTFQNPYSSYELSMSVRNWLSDHGVDIEYGTLRTNAHLVEYFILGIALVVFVKSRECKGWMAMAIGCGIGIMDEVVKIFLPGREFGKEDLFRDVIGVILAVVIVTLYSKNGINKNDKKMKNENWFGDCV